MARAPRGGEAAAQRGFLRDLPVADVAKVMGSRAKLQRVLDGADPVEVVNKGVPDGYRTVRLGEIASLSMSDDAYEVAKAGGAHAPWLREQRLLGVHQLDSAVRSLTKQVALHEDWIADPAAKVHDWQARDPRYREGLIRKWRQDIVRQQEQIGIVKGVLREKGFDHG